MNKKCYRFFGGLMERQAAWLNRMAERGYRLSRTEKLLYEFEPCDPGEYRYQVEFIGQKGRESAQDYARFLQDYGYRVFYKNINLNYSAGKVKWRPWAEPGGRIATGATTLNRELLIVEKKADGKDFELHTTYADRILYYKSIRKPGLFLLLISVLLGIAMRAWVWGIFAAGALFAVLNCQAELAKLRRQAKSREW